MGFGRLGAGASMDLKPGDRVRGAITGIYLGKVVFSGRDETVIRSPNGEPFLLGNMLLELIPMIEQETGRVRVWTN
jgi:hypothetical protein